MARCGNCGKDGATVAEIRACYQAKTMAAVTGSTAATVRYERRNPDGSLTVEGEAAYERPAPVEIVEGIWKLGETVYKVQTSRGYGGGEAGRLYGKRLVILDEPYEKTVRGKTVTVRAEWEFEGGVPGKLKRGGARQLDPDEAAAYGKLSGKCMFCGLDLTDERSMLVGYGPDCAEKHGLPWGETPAVVLGDVEAPEWTV